MPVAFAHPVPAAPASRGAAPIGQPRAMTSTSIYQDFLTCGFSHPILTVALYGTLCALGDEAGARSNAIAIMEQILSATPTMEDILNDSPEDYIGRRWFLTDLEVMCAVIPSAYLSQAFIDAVVDVASAISMRDALEARLGAVAAATPAAADENRFAGLSPRAAALLRNVETTPAPAVGRSGGPMTGFTTPTAPATPPSLPADDVIELADSEEARIERVRRILAESREGSDLTADDVRRLMAVAADDAVARRA